MPNWKGFIERCRQPGSNATCSRQQANAVQEKLSKHFKRCGVDEIVTDRKVRWEESEDVFSVTSTRLENLCRDCVHVVEFVHE